MSIYAAYDDGLRVVDPANERVDTRLDDQGVECLAVDSRTPDRVLAGTWNGLYRSDDGGKTFERVATDGLSSDGDGIDAVTALAVSPDDPETVLVGTEPSRIYRSTDGGRCVERIEGLQSVPSADEWSFPPRPDTHHVRWIETCPADPDRWYVGIEAGALVVTPDGGETWIDRPEGSRRDTHTIATHPDAPDRVYVAAGDGYAESDDRGASFATPNTGLDHGYVWGIAVDPGDPDRVLVSAASGASAAHRRGEAYLYRTEGAGGGSGDKPAWERLDDRGIPTGDSTYRAVIAGGILPGEVWVLNDRGLYRTTDGGGSFEHVAADLPRTAARALAVV
ncbi:WD40/YVTN/BNR-like repeat-containing protein [Halorubrum tibetense]|uniref:WD40/YVTN/BNR-like repeat-containing protein n=1 Tax=Halorubrum tibetense TaxID=175631 RepID=A0ABD5SAK3_9EURY